jgi:predicted dehydrogenase
MTTRVTRRQALRAAAGAALAAPFVYRKGMAAAPIETVRLAAIGAGGQGESDLRALTASKNLKLVAIADVDPNHAGRMIKAHPDAKLYSDWRKLLDGQKEIDAVLVSTPDHTHAPATMRAMQLGKHVYTQKPLTQTLYEARQLAKVAAEKKLVTQMGIQVHSAAVHKTIVKVIQDGTIGKVKEVHSWSGKDWGDRNPKPTRTDPVPANFDWSQWLGVAADRPFIGGQYYHPGNWRKRLDFGTGTFGDMGCHILDPVFGSLALTYPTSVRGTSGGPVDVSWGLDNVVEYTYPGTKYTADELKLTWYDYKQRPGPDVAALIPGKRFSGQGSIFIGTEGVLHSRYGDKEGTSLYPADKFKDYKFPEIKSDDHYLQWVEAIRGNGTTSAPFSYAGPLTELVLIGCLATRFQNQTLAWDSANMKVTNVAAANQFVRKTYRKGWEVEGL